MEIVGIFWVRFAINWHKFIANLVFQCVAAKPVSEVIRVLATTQPVSLKRLWLGAKNPYKQTVHMS